MATYFSILAREILWTEIPVVHGPWDRKEMDITEQLGTRTLKGTPWMRELTFLFLFFFVMWETHQWNGLGTEPHHSAQTHPAGAHRPGRPKAAPLCHLPADLLGDSGGNLGLIDVIRASTTLHTPMYFLLSLLSFLDVCSSSLFTPRLLISFLTADQSISFEGCVVQMALMTLMTLHGSGECVLLSIMAYDRFLAICPPLLYHSIISKHLCVQLVGLTYAVGVFISAVQTGNAFSWPYCGPNVIDHYSCDSPRAPAGLLRHHCGQRHLAHLFHLDHCPHSLSHLGLLHLHPGHHL